MLIFASTFLCAINSSGATYNIISNNYFSLLKTFMIHIYFTICMIQFYFKNKFLSAF